MNQGAIFDMDGLLLDTERVYQESWIETAKRFHQPVIPEFPTAVSGTSGETMVRIVQRYYPQVETQAFIAACFARVNRVIDRDGPQLKPGVPELLSFLREAGVRTAVASSSSRSRILVNLDAAGLTASFDAIVSGQEVLRGKPSPDIFLLAARKLGCTPDACWVFEDSVNGIRAAVAGSFKAVMVPDLAPPPSSEELAGFRVCESLLEVRDLIRQDRL